MELKHSFRTLFPVLLMLVFSPMFNGCVAMALVGAGSAGAYAISKDSIDTCAKACVIRYAEFPPIAEKFASFSNMTGT